MTRLVDHPILAPPFNVLCVRAAHKWVNNKLHQASYYDYTTRAHHSSIYSRQIKILRLSSSIIPSLLVLDDEWGEGFVLSPEKDSSDKVGHDSSGLVFAVSGSGYREDTIEFFKS